jgi:hypothetical protein
LRQTFVRRCHSVPRLRSGLAQRGRIGHKLCPQGARGACVKPAPSSARLFPRPPPLRWQHGGRSRREHSFDQVKVRVCQAHAFRLLQEGQIHLRPTRFHPSSLATLERWLMVTGVSPVLEAFIPKMSPLSVRQPGWRLSQCSSIQKDISVVLRCSVQLFQL